MRSKFVHITPRLIYPAAWLLAIVMHWHGGVGLEPLHADVLFGMTRQGWHSWERDHDMAPQGRFYATSDYGYTPGQPDLVVRDSWNYPRYTRGQVTATQPAGRLSQLFHWPWLSGAEKTEFGIVFDQPFKGDALPEDRPVTIDRIRICWGAHVPAPDSWGGIIVTESGDIVRIPIDPSTTIYPYDQTDLHFAPVAIGKITFVKKGPESGFDNNYLSINALNVFAAEKATIANHMVVWQPDFYTCVYDTTRPGSILKVFPMCEFFGTHPAFSMFSIWPMQPGILSFVEPVVIHRGDELQPITRDYPVRQDSIEGVDHVAFELAYKVSGQDEPFELNVATTFRRSNQDSITIDMKAMGSLPPETSIALRARGNNALFGPNLTSGVTPTLLDATQPVPLESAAGQVTLTTLGARTLAVVQDTHDYRADTQGLTIWKQRDYKQRGDYVFLIEADGDALTTSISLPLFERSKPASQNFDFYDADADAGDPDTAPFVASDLELVAEIDCGNADDPHVFHDVTNDPWLSKERFRERLRRVQPYSVDAAPIIDHPDQGAVPISMIQGQPCRAINDAYGAYFRYELSHDFEMGSYYLLVIEHAFDQMRRGTLEITDSNNFTMHTRAGLDTGVASHDGQFRRESFLFKAEQYFSPSPAHKVVRPWCLWISNAWQWQGWTKGPGPAVKSIAIYKVRRMPRTVDLTAMLPEDPTQRRHVGYHTQFFDPEFYRVDNALTGMNQVWTNLSSASALSSGLGYESDLSPAGMFHPGTIDGYAGALAVAAQNGALLKTYLAQILHWGYQRNHDAFAAYSESGYSSYNWCDMPLSLRQDEKELIEAALDNALSRLAPFPSLSVIATADPPGVPFTLRNLTDFSRETGYEVPAVPVVDRDALNAVALLDAGPETLHAWLTWVCEKRHQQFTWLRDKIREHRSDLTLMVHAGWTRGPMHPYWNNPDTFALSEASLARHGLTTYADYLKLYGYDAALYRGEKGIAMQIHAGWPAVSVMANNVRSIEVQAGQTVIQDRSGMPGPHAPDFSGEPWMKTLADSFAGGLNYSLSFNSEESSKPWSGHEAHCFTNRVDLQKSLIQAIVLNARFVDMETYAYAWSGRIADIRRFAVPFRLLPFTDPQPFEGTLCNASDTLIIRRHGTRNALINAGETDVTAILELPPGQTVMHDLSSGRMVEVEVSPQDGRHVAAITMPPYSLKVLTFQKENIP